MTQITVPISTETFLRLAHFLRSSGSALEPVSVVENAVNYWIDNAEWKGADLLPDSHGSGAYVWKVQRKGDRPASSLSLGSGTKLRIKTGASFEYATVEGDTLMYQDIPVSPNQFAKLATGTPRDAWRDVWVKRPDDQDYLHADALREALFTS